MELTKHRGLSAPIRAAIVAAAFLLALCASSRVFMPKDNTAEAGQIEPQANGILGEPANTVDVVFVGDSETSNSVSPLQMWSEQGFTSYVCASNGQKLPYSYTLLKRALANQSPRVVVLEANTLYTPFSTSKAMMRLAEDVFPVLEYHDRWKSLTAADIVEEPKATWTAPYKGFYLLNWAEGTEPTDNMAASDAVERLPFRSKLYLRLLVETIRAAGAVPVIEATPSLVCWSTARHNEVAAVAEELGVDFIDLNEMTDEMGIDWASDTRDGGEHMNYTGATKVTAKLGALLDEAYDLPDHRDDAAYASWDDAYQALLDAVAETEADSSS